MRASREEEWNLAEIYRLLGVRGPSRDIVIYQRVRETGMECPKNPRQFKDLNQQGNTGDFGQALELADSAAQSGYLKPTFMSTSLFCCTGH